MLTAWIVVVRDRLSPMTTRPPVALKRQIAAMLTQLRAKTGLTLEAAAARSEVTKSSLSRFENGHTAPKIHTLRALMDLYQATDEERETLEQLVREASKRGWGAQYFGEGLSVPDWLRTYVGLEATASFLNIYDFLVPGLLQTSDYARAVISASGRSGEELERRVKLRVLRQGLLDDGPLKPRVHAILDESVMHRQVGSSDVMRGQMCRLAQLARLPNVTIQILPFDNGSASTSIGGPFVILGLDPEPPLVYLEHYELSHYVEGAPQVRSFTLAFEGLTRAALTPDESVKVLASASKREG